MEPTIEPTQVLELVQASKMIGAAIAAIPMYGAAMSLGNFFSSAVETMGRNPSVAAEVNKRAMVYFAFIEAIAIFSFVLAVMILVL